MRRAFYSVFTIPGVNTLGRFLLSRFSFPLLYRSRYVFPVKGLVPVRYGENRSFVMVSDGSDTIASRVFFGGALGFEKATSAILTRYFANGGVFFDVGANSGVYSLMAATFPEITEIHAFEPVSGVHAILEANVKANRIKNVRANRLALGDHNGKVDLIVPTGITLPTGSSERGSQKFDHLEEHTVETVRLLTLDDYISENSITRCDLIKIDTETTEAAVIRGAIKTIAKFRPLIVCEVIRNSVAREIEEVLSPLGYDYFHLTENGIVPCQTMQPDEAQKDMNFLLMPRRDDLSSDDLNDQDYRNGMVSIVTVNYNSRELLRACLRSLEKHVRVPYEVIVVDNASSDDSAHNLPGGDKVKVLFQNSNLGFAKGCNVGARAAKGQILHFLNPDTEVDESINATYVSALKSPEVCTYTTYLANTDGVVEKSRHVVPTLTNMLKLVVAPTRAEHWHIGASVLVRPELYWQQGGFSEEYFMYGEDLDFFYKFMRAGIPNRQLSAVVVHHKGGCSKNVWSAWQRLHVMEKSGFVFAAKFGVRFDYFIFKHLAFARNFLRHPVTSLMGLEVYWRTLFKRLLVRA